MKAFYILSWFFGLAVFTTGILNIILVHYIPGLIYLLLAMVYFFPGNPSLILRPFHFMLPLMKILLAIILILFTFGVSDLGEIVDKL